MPNFNVGWHSFVVRVSADYFEAGVRKTVYRDIPVWLQVTKTRPVLHLVYPPRYSDAGTVTGVECRAPVYSSWAGNQVIPNLMRDGNPVFGPDSEYLLSGLYSYSCSSPETENFFAGVPVWLSVIVGQKAYERILTYPNMASTKANLQHEMVFKRLDGTRVTALQVLLTLLSEYDGTATLVAKEELIQRVWRDFGIADEVIEDGDYGIDSWIPEDEEIIRKAKIDYLTTITHSMWVENNAAVP